MPDTTLLKLAAAYIRVSDERQDEYSPDSQLKKIREYAEREGYMIPEEYVFYDDGISAKTAEKRHEFNRMVAMTKEKDCPFKIIYVWKFSRFARNQEESMVYKNLLRKKGVTVVSVSEPIPEGHFGTLIERIIEWMDEFYLINLGAEVTRGMTEKASRGEPTCAPPYGYIMKDGKYFPDEESGAANVIREIFERYDRGEKQRAIATSLGDRGVRTKYGNTPDNRWIEYILYNPCYIGKIRWSMENARAVSKRDYANENIMTVDGHHEPLISQDLWDSVQLRLEAQKKAYPKYAKRDQPIDYMLKGLVRCSSCGGTLACSGYQNKAGDRSMQCCNYSRGSCHVSHFILTSKLETAFIDGLNQAAETGIFRIALQSKKKHARSDEPDYEKLIAAEERRLQRAKEAYLAEIDTIEQYAANKRSITARIEKLKKALAETPVQAPANVEEYIREICSLVKFITRPDASSAAKNELIRAIVDHVTFDRPSNAIEIHFRER